MLKRASGPVTDYGSTLVHWMRNRLPKWQGSYNGEVERPSPSYIIDVSPQMLETGQGQANLTLHARCSPL